MELLVLRLDHLKARSAYTTTLKTWLQESKLNGRLVSRGNLHVLVMEGPSAGIDTIAGQFETEPIDTNARDERCVDRFYDIVGREARETAKLKSGFTDMQLLNDAMLEKLVIDEWGVPRDWLDAARLTDRTKRFLAWKDEAKLARKQGRRRTAQVRDETKLKKREEKNKRQKLEQDAAAVNADSDVDDAAK
ncbi:Aste57867_12216 [Aphanomyces stellatus]|uniref:Aste57867_12216 protein n=1 Tax=Aphanomyces stellatus TaxID=120398 RepID=A0A485KVF6_9STRA|nr:hypothetical protein As57867_012171 [Aphanomyces stellatus]VFT89070.1 Aste57867_12216 [Aphanomyces stellatus]